MKTKTVRWLDMVEEESGLPAVTRHLLLSLGRYEGADGSSFYPEPGTLADRMGISEKTVSIQFDLAESEGWLERTTAADERLEYRPTIPNEIPKESHPSGLPTAEEIGEERSRYSPTQLWVIDEALDAFRSARRTNRMADSVVLAEFRWWSGHPVDHVVEGLRTYIAKGCADEGKKEQYARGIIRNFDESRAAQSKKADFPDMDAGKTAFLAERRTQSEELTQ